MELIVTWCVALSIGLFIARECVLIYFTRTKSKGMILETEAVAMSPNEVPTMLRTLDRLILLVIILTLLVYCALFYIKWTQHEMGHELQMNDVGIGILICILWPSRKVAYLITENGLYKQMQVTDWESIYVINVESEPSLRKKRFVQFRGPHRVIEGYMNDHDVCS